MDTYEELMKFIREKREEISSLYNERQEFFRQNPELPANAVLDEEKSVRWNREEVEHRNRSRKAKFASYMTKINRCERDIDQKIRDFVREEYGFSEAVTNIVFNEAYEAGHSGGYEEVISSAREYASFAERIIDAMNA